MEIQEYKSRDCNDIAELFYDTVHTVNVKDYEREQLNAWASGNIDIAMWDKSFLDHYTLVARDGDMIIGFGDIDDTGYLDRLYVHRDYQGQGVARAICDILETHFVVEHITTHASITAKGFFLKRGYKIIKEQQVERKGIKLINYVMKK